jgi:hypothetical protein
VIDVDSSGGDSNAAAPLVHPPGFVGPYIIESSRSWGSSHSDGSGEGGWTDATTRPAKPERAESVCYPRKNVAQSSEVRLAGEMTTLAPSASLCSGCRWGHRALTCRGTTFHLSGRWTTGTWSMRARTEASQCVAFQYS